MKITWSILGKDIVEDVEKAVHFLANTETKVNTATPGALAAFGLLISGIEKALTDVSGAATNPILGLMNAPATIEDFKTLWPELKAFAASFGIK